MDRLFQDFFGAAPFEESLRDLWNGGRSFPALNLWEDDDHFFMEAEVPGLDLDDLDLTVTRKVLTLAGERKRETPANTTEHRREIACGAFRRSLTLPAEIDTDRVHAEMKHGVLTITLPKAEAHRPRRIDVAAAGI